MSTTAFIFFNIIWLVAGFITGVASFGANLFAIPLMTLAIGTRDSIVVGCLGSVIIFVALGGIYIRQARWKEILLLGISGLFGSPPGIWFLSHAGPRPLMLAAGASLAIFLIWQFLADRLHVGEKVIPLWTAIPFGFLSGIMFSAVGMGGPPVVLYTYLRKWSKESTICGTSLAAGIQMCGVAPGLVVSGLCTREVIVYSLWAAGFALIGILLSVPVAKHINQKLFRILLLAMLALSASMLLIRGIFGEI